MKKIYIILTYTGTFLSKMIHVYTKENYTHSSISLDENLNKMYSFGRYNAYNPFWGGFVKENPNINTFKRFYNTKAIIYSLEITNEQYELVENEIKIFILNQKQYGFNILGLFAILFHIKIKRKYKFYCAEFVKYILEKADVTNTLPELVHPEDFQNIANLKLIYKGKLRNYNKKIKHKNTQLLQSNVINYNS